MGQCVQSTLRWLYSRPSPRFRHCCSRVPPPSRSPDAIDQYDLSWFNDDIGDFPDDHLEFLSVINNGANALCSKARNKDTGEIVAVRTRANCDWEEFGGDGSDWMPYVQREIRALEAASDIKGVVKLKRAYHMDKNSHLEFELLPGGSLMERLRTGEYLDEFGRSAVYEWEARQWMRPVVETYAQLLAKGLYQGDQHLDNIVFDADGCPKLVDFELVQFFTPATNGLSLRDPSQRLVGSGLDPHGVEFYMSPEAASPHTFFDPHKATVYSLGQMLRMLLEFGHDPATRDVMRPYVRTPFWRMNLSADVMELIDSMTADDPAMRPSIVQVLAHPFWFGQGGVTSPVTSPEVQPHVNQRSQPAATAVGSVRNPTWPTAPAAPPMTAFPPVPSPVLPPNMTLRQPYTHNHTYGHWVSGPPPSAHHPHHLQYPTAVTVWG